MRTWIGVLSGIGIGWAVAGWAGGGIHLVYTADLRSTLGLCG